MDYKLSIIVPCYNSSSTINKLLDSIVDNDLEKNEYELIICDDNSTDNFTDIVKTYEDRMNISYYKTETNVHCPGNTRQLGLEKAKGEWITFIDHDDYFEPNIFKEVFKIIEEEKIDTVLSTSFHGIDEDDENQVEEYVADENNLPWLHGKFYNHQMLINQNIYFEKDLESHEDVYFNKLIEVYLETHEKHFHFAPQLYTYNWIQRKASVSHQREGNLLYMDLHFKEFIYSSTEPYFIITNDENRDYCLANLMANYLLAYFVYQQGIYRLGEEYPKYNQFVISEFKQKILKTYNLTNEDIINHIYSDPNYYNMLKVKSFGNINVGFVESQSFRDFVWSH